MRALRDVRVRAYTSAGPYLLLLNSICVHILSWLHGVGKHRRRWKFFLLAL